ncbi:RAMP superfamily CRISPR-associated protein [Faecalicatena orotica]|uniref:RAMP superfamily CRISPR-associated protein n=1 Tax=Faecalicatena orotica TaxID=1544 RepID=UPI00321760B3
MKIERESRTMCRDLPQTPPKGMDYGRPFGCNKICGRLCIELEGSLASALSIGSGEQEKTDSDIILDSKGNPFIPGSALAGALRAYTGEIGREKEADQLFGKPKDELPGAASDRQSRIFVYDTQIQNAQIGIRDGVRLGEAKTADYKSKYEIQIIESNANFKMRLEFIERESQKAQNDLKKLMNDDLRMVWNWVHGFTTGELRLGARSQRGFGQFKIEKVRIKTFNMEEQASYLEWLEWDWEKPDAFILEESIDITHGAEGQYAKWLRTEGKEAARKFIHCFEVPLDIPYTLLIRTYSTTFKRTDEMPDYGQLTAGGRGEEALIPGSSIAGAFRSHIAKIIKEIAHLESWEKAQSRLNPFFGTWMKNDAKNDGTGDKILASRIIFEETVVKGGNQLPVFRNAIDRFTGGTVEGALYEEVPWAGGNVLLRIFLQKDRHKEGTQDSDDIICGLLLWAILDLQAGILPIGGETAIGRGIFSNSGKKWEEILLDGQPLSEQKKEKYLQRAVQWAKETEDECTEG